MNNGSALGITGDTQLGNGSGNDSITNNGTASGISGDSQVQTGSGSDVIVNNGTADAIFGDSQSGDGSGNDGITNNGTVTQGMGGDSDSGNGTGDDVLINNGYVGGILAGDNRNGTGTGNDTITNAGTVNGDIIAGGGTDTVTIQGNNAVVTGTIDGGAGTDTLTFELSSSNPDELNALAAEIAAANPAGGTLTFNGRTFVWQNFEQLFAILTLMTAPRLNELSAPVAVFCATAGGIDVYALTAQGRGDFSQWVSEGAAARRR